MSASGYSLAERQAALEWAEAEAIAHRPRRDQCRAVVGPYLAAAQAERILAQRSPLLRVTRVVLLRLAARGFGRGGGRIITFTPVNDHAYRPRDKRLRAEIDQILAELAESGLSAKVHDYLITSAEGVGAAHARLIEIYCERQKSTSKGTNT